MVHFSVYCHTSLLKLEYTCYYKTPIAICSRTMQESSAARNEWMSEYAAMKPSGFFANRDFDVQCPAQSRDVYAWWFQTILTTYRWLYVIIATHNPSKLAAHNFAVPARLGRPIYKYVSLIQKIGRKIWADFCSSFKLLAPNWIGYRRPIQQQRYHKASAILNSVSHHTHKVPVVIFI